MTFCFAIEMLLTVRKTEKGSKKIELSEEYTLWIGVLTSDFSPEVQTLHSNLNMCARVRAYEFSLPGETCK